MAEGHRGRGSTAGPSLPPKKKRKITEKGASDFSDKSGTDNDQDRNRNNEVTQNKKKKTGAAVTGTQAKATGK